MRETGARPRIVESVVDELIPLLDNWDAIESPLDEHLIDAFLAWAYRQVDFQRDLRDGFPEREQIPPRNLPDPTSVRRIVVRWLAGDTFAEIATATRREVDEVLRIYGTVISFSFATLVEQAVAVLERYLADAGVSIAEPVAKLAEYLRYGVPAPHARLLMAAGVRHRRAALLLGTHPAMTDPENFLREPRDVARELIAASNEWVEVLGPFVFDRTVADLGEAPEPDRGFE